MAAKKQKIKRITNLATDKTYELYDVINGQAIYAIGINDTTNAIIFYNLQGIKFAELRNMPMLVEYKEDSRVGYIDEVL